MSFTTAFPILHTDNLDQLVAFYSQLMGLPVTYKFPPEGEPQFVTVGVGDSTIGLGAYTGVERFVGAIPRGGRPFQLCLYTDDLDADLMRLRAAGVTVHLEPIEQPWNERLCYIADPDGNLIMLTQPWSGG
jgi:lactoylglutathione lyase